MHELLIGLAVAFTAAVCGLGFRLRGGLGQFWMLKHMPWMNMSLKWTAWSVLVAALSMSWYALTLPWAVAVGVAMWLGCRPGWYGGRDLSRVKGTWLQDAWTLTWRGAVWAAPITGVFAYLGLVHVALAIFVMSSLAALWYEIGWRLPSSIKGLESGIEMGEFVFGIVFGLTLALCAVI